MCTTRYLGVALAVVASGFAACAPAEDRSVRTESVTISLLSGGRCEVLSKEMACPDVPTYMRDTLKMDGAVQVSLIAQGKPTYDETMALFEALGRAGFKGKVGIVDVADMEK